MRRHPLRFVYAFDLPPLDGEGWLRRPLDERRAHVPALIDGSGLLLSEPRPGTAAQIVTAVGRLGIEGIVARRGDPRYEPGARSDAWRTFGLQRQQEFVVGGFLPSGRSSDALVVGVGNDRQPRDVAREG